MLNITSHELLATVKMLNHWGSYCVADLRQTLQDAIGTGELIRVVYYGGSQPGHSREILPRRVDDEHVRATCAETGEYRTFRLDRMELATGPLNASPKYVPGAGNDGPHFEDLWALCNVLEQAALQPGRYLMLRPDRVEVFECFKNGRPKKQPVLELRQAGLSWVVNGRNEVQRRFQRFDRAAAAFVASDWWSDDDRDAIEDALQGLGDQQRPRDVQPPSTPGRSPGGQRKIHRRRVSLGEWAILIVLALGAAMLAVFGLSGPR